MIITFSTIGNQFIAGTKVKEHGEYFLDNALAYIVQRGAQGVEHGFIRLPGNPKRVKIVGAEYEVDDGDVLELYNKSLRNISLVQNGIIIPDEESKIEVVH